VPSAEESAKWDDYYWAQYQAYYHYYWHTHLPSTSAPAPAPAATTSAPASSTTHTSGTDTSAAHAIATLGFTGTTFGNVELDVFTLSEGEDDDGSHNGSMQMVLPTHQPDIRTKSTRTSIAAAVGGAVGAALPPPTESGASAGADVGANNDDGAAEVDHEQNVRIRKYWAQRYRFFSKYDEGIKLDEESCAVRVLRQNFALEDAIGSHACSLEANMRVTNGIPLGSPLLLPLSP
jgi:hypothetical protein